MSVFAAALQRQREQGLLRSLTALAHAPSKWIERNGVRCLNCASNNYLDLAGHPRLKQRALEALESYGTGSGGSRLLGGNLPLHEELEMALSRYRPLGKALLLNSGFQANLTMVSTLGDFLGGVFADKLAHASVAEGLRLSREPFHRFRHNDLNHLEELLRKHQPKQGGLVVTETLFSMDGDFAPLEELAVLQKRYGFWLLLDEAHSTGCDPGLLDLDKRGLRGLSDQVVLMGTFGKALGSFGAYAAGPADAIDTLINFGRGFIFSTSLPPSVLGANLGALETVQNPEESWRPKRLREIATFAREELRSRGFDLGPSESHIVPVRLGTPEAAVSISQSLFSHGIHAPAIRPPTVPEGTSRLRLNMTAAFTEEDVLHVAEALERAAQSLNSRDIDSGNPEA